MWASNLNGAGGNEFGDGFRLIVERLPQGVAVHSDGVLLYVNPALARMLGYDPDEVVGRSWRDFRRSSPRYF
jgi:PAS domain S-box-containing protein